MGYGAGMVALRGRVVRGSCVCPLGYGARSFAHRVFVLRATAFRRSRIVCSSFGLRRFVGRGSYVRSSGYGASSFAGRVFVLRTTARDRSGCACVSFGLRRRVLRVHCTGGEGGLNRCAVLLGDRASLSREFSQN